LYYDTDKNPSNGRTLIPVGASLAAPPGGAFESFLPLVQKGTEAPPEIDPLIGVSRFWNTTGVPPGPYYISADVSDGFMTTTWYSEVPVIIVP